MKIKNIVLVIAVTIAIIASYKIGAAHIDFTRGYFEQVMLPFLNICAMWIGVFIVAMICVLSGNYGDTMHAVETVQPETVKPETVETKTVSPSTAYELRMKNAQMAYELRMENARRAHDLRMENARRAYELRMGK